MKKIRDINQIFDHLETMRAGDVVEYWRGVTLKGCDYGWILWDMAMRGEIHLVQRKYGPFDFGYQAIKAGFKVPLSERMQFFGRDDRGRRARLVRDDFAPGGPDPLYAPDGGTRETESSLA